MIVMSLTHMLWKRKKEVYLPLCQVESLFDTSGQWFQLPEHLPVRWSLFESDLFKPEGVEDFIDPIITI